MCALLCRPYAQHTVITQHYAQHAQQVFENRGSGMCNNINGLTELFSYWFSEWGSGGPGFKSPRPDQKNTIENGEVGVS